MEQAKSHIRHPGGRDRRGRLISQLANTYTGRFPPSRCTARNVPEVCASVPCPVCVRSCGDRRRCLSERGDATRYMIRFRIRLRVDKYCAVYCYHYNLYSESLKSEERAGPAGGDSWRGRARAPGRLGSLVTPLAHRASASAPTLDRTANDFVVKPRRTEGSESPSTHPAFPGRPKDDPNNLCTVNLRIARSWVALLQFAHDEPA